MGGCDRLPLPTLTVSRMGALRGDLTSAASLQSPQNANDASKLAAGAVRCPIRKSGAKGTKCISIEETLHRRSGLRESMRAMRSRSSPALGRSERLGSPQGAFASPQKPAEMSEVPRTMTPTPLHVALGGFERQDPWASLLCGKQRIQFPAHATQGCTDETIAWYNRRELENRCSLQSPEAREKESHSLESPLALGWTAQEGKRSPSRSSTAGQTGECSILRRSLVVSPTSQRIPAALLPKIENGGWSRLHETSAWAEQARTLASWRVSMTSQPSADLDRALHDRLRLFDFLERHEISKGVEALRSAFCFRFGDLEQAFRYFDIAGNGRGPSFLEMSGSLALLGFDASSLCGCTELDLFLKMDVDRDGRIGLEDLLGTSIEPMIQPTEPHSRKNAFRNTHIVTRSESVISEIAQDMETWSNDEEAVLDPEGRDRWALIVKFIALSSWFHTPPEVRQRGRPAKEELTCGRTGRHQPATPVVRAPGRGDIGHGSARGMDQFSLLKFKKVSTSAIPDGWRLATHKEVVACKSDVLLLMDAWDICGLANGWRFDGAKYGHNLQEPCGQVEFAMVIVCCEEIHDGSTPSELPPLDHSMPGASTTVSLPSQSCNSTTVQTGQLAKQQALDALRLCWSPNEADFEDAQRVLQLHFMARASVRQFGEPLLSRKDVDRLLGRLPPPGLEEAPFNRASSPPLHRTPSFAEARKIYDEVLEIQVVLSSLKGKTLSKGLTFESFRVVLQRLSLALDLHFRHLVDDAFEAHAESAGFVV